MKYRKKPVVVDVVQWTGVNRQDIIDFVPDATLLSLVCPWLPFEIGTLEGKHIASVGDYIIRGVAGEYYPCKPAIFEATYECVE